VGQLGDGTTIERDIPVPVAGGHTFAVINVGDGTTCAATATGEAWCWGYGNKGQLGDGQWTDSHVPARVLGNDRFASISAGGDQTCGVTLEGEGRCWGDNYAGELGDGHPLYLPVPNRVLGGKTFTSLSGGGQGMCGLTANDETWCWGTVGDSVDKRSTPLQLTGDPRFTAMSLGSYSGCGIDGDGQGWCWGRGSVVGNGSRVAVALTPVPISGGLRLASIAVGTHACALTTSGDPYCWGERYPVPVDAATPTLVGGGFKFVMISGGWDHDCGLTDAGAPYCWGSNYGGQLGTGTTGDSPTPLPVLGGLHFTTISAGIDITCGVATDGRGYCWYLNPNVSGVSTSSTPTLVSSGLTFTRIDVSHGYGMHACGTTISGAIYCWGSNGLGQLGNGQTDRFSLVPSLVIGGLTAAPRP
jgi:alpha-tubulin suppressor-like RCC1 family protein